MLISNKNVGSITAADVKLMFDKVKYRVSCTKNTNNFNYTQINATLIRCQRCFYLPTLAQAEDLVVNLG